MTGGLFFSAYSVLSWPFLLPNCGVCMSPFKICRYLLLIALLAYSTIGHAFDRAAAGAAYEQWFEHFIADVGHLRNALIDNPDLTPEDVDRICAASIAPHSRMSAFILDLAQNSVRQGDVHSGGEIVSFGPLYLLQYFLAESLPAGDGGLWPEPDAKQFPTTDVRVLYVHINGGSILAGHLNNPDYFAPYHLPPDGVLQRKAYPFLLFQNQQGRLRLAGLGQEYWGALNYLYSIQFM